MFSPNEIVTKTVTSKPEIGPVIDAPNQPDYLDEVIQWAEQKIAPVWPLKDYVAVNPYAGFACQEFLSTREYLRTLSDLEFFMPVDYYRQQLAQGELHRNDISAAVDELVADRVDGSERIDVNQVVSLLRETAQPGPTADAEFAKTENPNRTLFTLCEIIDSKTSTDWCQTILSEISKHCAAHYDNGQATWSSPHRDLPLFTAWQLEKRHDRSFEILGVSGFRDYVATLPHDGRSALCVLLQQLGLPRELWKDYLLCTALTMPGWSSWTRYQQREAENAGRGNDDFVGLIAIRLAYEVALSNHLNFHVAWSSYAQVHVQNREKATHPSDHDLLRYALLKASEIAFRNRLLSDLNGDVSAATPGHRITSHVEDAGSTTSSRSLAQMVFCIDVRSERVRRHLEATSAEIETFGFAGFFGVPMEFVKLGATQGSPNVPALITPAFKVHEQIDNGDAEVNAKAIEQRGRLRFMRKAWKEFQSSSVSTFAFVESTGLLYGWKLLSRSLGWTKPTGKRFDGVGLHDHAKMSPSLDSCVDHGFGITEQTNLAESILRGMGIVDDFGRLVVFCGHACEVENNPLQAGLDCGACGGHSGEPNARFAAKLLNHSQVRAALCERGIEIPTDTHFVAALHNTTTDEIKFLDDHLIPQSHLGDREQLDALAADASQRTRSERLRSLPGPNEDDLTRRSRDWSEVRPEWGLAGNAAFVAAPRSLTQSVSLDGRSFLHSYDYRKDSGFAVLEQIMTAPMVVANWINMQYYASTVDPIHFGSGNKTVHNVVGQFGVFSGNGGDLLTGLPWQSVHDGQRYQHHPLRLLAVLAAPRLAIESILEKHANVAHLVASGWLHLIAVEDGEFYRYTEQQNWEKTSGTLQPIDA
ncbi:MAG: YbcC family protein [Rhodopirellula sp. JB044]|uniref:YbcC family protein n=1 Tax=Rhodopirellula sp. JB044 TaxID=3342844 RepID=UPI00370B261B